MSQSVSLLTLVGILVVLLGLIGIAAIILVSKSCRRKLQQHPDLHEEQQEIADPWIEAGKRMNFDTDEPE